MVGQHSTATLSTSYKEQKQVICVQSMCFTIMQFAAAEQDIEIRALAVMNRDSSSMTSFPALELRTDEIVMKDVGITVDGVLEGEQNGAKKTKKGMPNCLRTLPRFAIC